MHRNPPLSLIRFLSAHNDKEFCASCSYINLNDVEDDDEDPLQYCTSTFHLAAEYSESVELLQILLQLDVSMTKKKALHDHMAPLGTLNEELFRQRWI